MDQQTTKRTQEKSRPTGGERLVKQDTGGNAEAEVVLYQPDSSIHIEVLVEKRMQQDVTFDRKSKFFPLYRS